MKKLLALSAPLLAAVLVFAQDAPSQLEEAEAAARELRAPDEYTLVGDKSFYTDFTAKNRDGTVNVVVEIPTGTTAKWEVDKEDGALKWEFRQGRPRIVRYLGYPGNYGMIPRTLLPEEAGGDGDPLDVLVLGRAVTRGAVVSARVIGVLKMLDGREQDDKLLAVLHGTALDTVRDLEELDEQFPGVRTIVETWFANYKGPGAMEIRGWGTDEDAAAVLDEAAVAFGAAVRAGR